ncbi:hypothetical protein N7520_011875 [Penicillium odoratum]|uniref:uncharacterized protein n=1 Tax=Penicillium odoratum TaxID=1167516 RepID=UPI0025487798|nr:uncharacterized protein N7520_011875 [Penicillium odoratum]KAJ5746693.1 hypothetical protein N7520_011875 [Penicillium odoratum]
MPLSSDPANHYQTLEVPPGCTEKEINASFRRLVLLHHPDKTGGDIASLDIFYQIQEAGYILRNRKRRRCYDESLQVYPAYRGNGERYHSSDNPQNWDGCPPQEDYQPWNSPDSNEGHKYSFGTDIHMDEDSDWNEMDEWVKRTAGIDPEVEKATEEFRRQATETHMAADQEPILGEISGSDTDENAIGHGYIDSDVQEAEERLHAHAAQGGKSAGDVDSMFQNTDDESSEDSCNTGKIKYDKDNIWNMEYEKHWPGVETEARSAIGSGHLIDLTGDEQAYEPRSCFPQCNEADDSGYSEAGLDIDMVTDIPSLLIDLSDEEQEYEARSNPPKGKKAHVPIDSDAATEKEDPHFTEMSDHSANDQTSDVLEPYIPFFAMKLRESGTCYTVEDMHLEMRGVFQEFFGHQVEDVRLPAKIVQPDLEKSTLHCSHRGTWSRSFGYSECEVCHLWMQVSTLTCPSCGTKACVRCKYAHDE